MSVIKNRADLLAFLREKAKYTGPDELDKVKSFVAENVELNDEAGKPVDIESVWAIEPKSKLKLTASLTAQEDEDEARLSGQKAREEAKGAGKPATSGKAARMYGGGNPSPRDGAKKSYDQRCKNRSEYDRKSRPVFSCADQAESFAAALRVRISGGKWYPKLDEDLDIVGKTMSTTTNSAGGALTFDEYRAELIDLREAYGGILGSVIPMTPMSRDVVTVPRQTGNLTVYAPGEAGAITASDPGTDNVNLVAKKLATLTYVPSELFNDAAVNVSDFLSRDIVWSFAKALETDALIGDGTSTYHGFVGAAYKPRKVLEDAGGTWTTDANKTNLAGFASAAGNAWSEITLANMEDVVSRYPYYGAGSTPEWLCSSQFYWNVMAKLAYQPGASAATAGATATEVVNGVPMYRFLGFPVRISNAMPRVEANSQLCCLFGDYARGMKVGEVTGSMSIATSADFDFDNDLISIRGLTRNAISVHDVGNYNSTAASRLAGPICGLITLNS